MPPVLGLCGAVYRLTRCVSRFRTRRDVVEQNPFERIVVKRKREVLGQYAKAQEVRTGQARSQAHKQVGCLVAADLDRCC